MVVVERNYICFELRIFFFESITRHNLKRTCFFQVQYIYTTHTDQDEVAEWLRRWTANPLCSARMGSNPIPVVKSYWTVTKAVVAREKNSVCFKLNIFLLRSITRLNFKRTCFFQVEQLY